VQNFNIVSILAARGRFLKVPKDKGVPCAISLIYLWGPTIVLTQYLRALTKEG
jgi:hypothetical protein